MYSFFNDHSDLTIVPTKSQKRERRKILNKDDYGLAHKYCGNNKPELEKDEICGCFYCMQIFSPLEID